MKKKRYRSIFISDIHLGSDISKISDLLEFLDEVKCEYLYICGDFIDFLHLYEHHGWSKNCNLIIRKLLSKVRKGAKIRICIGNHDAFFGIVESFDFGNIEIKHEFIHENVFVDYLVLHGDRFDKSMKLNLIIKALNFFYVHFHWVPFVGFIKRIIDEVAERNINTEEMMQYAKSKGAHGVIFGHTHRPVCTKNLMNCGDWIDHCTAIVETEDGEFELIEYQV